MNNRRKINKGHDEDVQIPLMKNAQVLTKTIHRVQPPNTKTKIKKTRNFLFFSCPANFLGNQTEKKEKENRRGLRRAAIFFFFDGVLAAILLVARRLLF